MLGIKIVRIIDRLGKLLFAAVPLAIFVGFIISLVQYKKCPSENVQERKKYKLAAVILGIVIVIMVLAAVAFMIWINSLDLIMY